MDCRDIVGFGLQILWRWVAKLVAHLLGMAALSKRQNGRHKQRSPPKIYKKNLLRVFLAYYSLNMVIKRNCDKISIKRVQPAKHILYKFWLRKPFHATASFNIMWRYLVTNIADN
jgi:hypothetical protein